MSTPKKSPLHVKLSGTCLLNNPLLNKSTAFSVEERKAFGLTGLLPHTIETVEQQAVRAYEQYQACTTNLERHVYLRDLQDANETLYYRVVVDHVVEMLPIIYTPIVGEACQKFSKIYRNNRGLFIRYEDRGNIDAILAAAAPADIRIIVVSDCERILGLGDQGAGGMGIPIGKLALYTACGGINPSHALPIVLDVGTNNQERLDAPEYIGCRHPRVTGDEYYAFVDEFVQAVKRRWPQALLQFEDFAQTTALPLLEKYRDNVCCFNDDIQGTAAIAVGTLWAACKATGAKISEQTIVFLGAGSAGCGIAEQIISAMKLEGLTEAQARKQIYVLNSKGLVTDKATAAPDYQQRLAQKSADIAGWKIDSDEKITLLDTVRNAKPTILVGVAAQPGSFTEEIIKLMHSNCAQPIVLPLSNPTSKIEATPEQILTWTNGAALVATGSPFTPVEINGKKHNIAQCNNAYVFPGIGLGVLVTKARIVTENMMMASSSALTATAPIIIHGKGDLLPPMTDIHAVSKKIAFDVAKQAMADGVADKMSDEALKQAIEDYFWTPEYREYVKA